MNIDIVERGEAIVLLVEGELDLCTAPTLQDRLWMAEATDAASIVVDLAGVEFMDMAGVHVLLQHSLSLPCRLSLASTPPHIRRVFGLAGLGDWLRDSVYSEAQTARGTACAAGNEGLLDRNLDLEHASYFVSRIAITPTNTPAMAPRGKKLFIAMDRNATTPVDHFGLPTNRTVMMGSQVPL